MNVAWKKNASACVYDGKIYVIEGCVEVEDSWAEVFDTKTQIWECLPDPDLGTELRKYYIFGFAEMEGNIHFRNSNTTYAYDTKQGKWECCKGRIAFPMSKCVMDSVSYRYDRYELIWSNDRYCQVAKGLDSLGELYKRNGGSSGNTTKLVSYGGKLFLIWEGYTRNPNNMKKICCAEIVIEKRDRGEVWGKAEWVDVAHRVPSSCQLLHCLVVSV